MRKMQAPLRCKTYRTEHRMDCEPDPESSPGPNSVIATSLNIIWIKSIRKCEKHQSRALQRCKAYCIWLRMSLEAEPGSFPGPKSVIDSSLNIIWIKSIIKSEKHRFRASQRCKAYCVWLRMGFEVEPGSVPGLESIIDSSLVIIWIKSIRKCEKNWYEAP
jgi:hypothetical protein